MFQDEIFQLSPSHPEHSIFDMHVQYWNCSAEISYLANPVTLGAGARALLQVIIFNYSYIIKIIFTVHTFVKDNAL